MTTETMLTDAKIYKIATEFEFECDHGIETNPVPNTVEFARAIEQAVLQSPEIQRLRVIEKAAQGVLDWTDARHRPPVSEALPVGGTAGVRVHALADLHDALHPDSPAKREPLPEQP